MNQGHSFPRSASVLVGSSAFIAAAAYLGVGWLRELTLGLPVGVWLILAAMAAEWLTSKSRNAQEVSARADRVFAFPRFAQVPGRALAAIWEAARSAARTLRVPASSFASIEDRMTARVVRRSTSTHPIRIGLDAGPDTRRALMDAESRLDVEWVILSPSANDQAAIRRHNLDALLRTSGEGPGLPIRVVSREYPEREAAWYDWSTPRPLTYAAVFPLRVDVSRVTLESVDLGRDQQATLFASTLRAAAVLSRCPARLRLSDHLTGRSPSARRDEAVRTPNSLADRSMLELVDALVASGSDPSPVARAAGRVVSAWLASTEAWLDRDLRRKGVEAALSVVGEEPEILLRAAAVRLAMFEDDAAFDLFRTAERIIRSGTHPTLEEHLAFLQAELELGSPNPLTLGRVASGICLVCATSPREKVAFIRGDIMDDVRHSAWLVGRDQDRQVLREVFSLMGADQPNPTLWELRDAA